MRVTLSSCTALDGADITHLERSKCVFYFEESKGSISAYFSSKQLLAFGFARQYVYKKNIMMLVIQCTCQLSAAVQS